MKKCLLWMALLVVGATLLTCKNDADPVALQKVQFMFGLPATPSGGRTQATVPTALLLSLENSAGEPVFTFKKIDLLQLGSAMMTEPIPLPPGTYTITAFLLVDDDDVVLYVTPKVESPLAGAVTHPLPYSFTVNSDDVSTVAMEVVDASQSAPEDFGYATFNIHSVNPLRLAVFMESHSDLVLTTATATVSHNDEVLGNYVLEAKTNVLSFPGEPAASYRLIVSKPGFKTYVKDFVYSELLDSLNGAPFQVVLHRFTINIKVEDDRNTLRFLLDGFEGTSVDVHWGDNTSDHVVFGADPSAVDLTHTYGAAQRYEVIFTGDIESITSFRLAYDQPTLEAIDVQALTNLDEFFAVLTPGPSLVDLSQNTRLTAVAVTDNRQLRHLILPTPNHILGSKQIIFVDIEGATGLSTADVDDIIRRVYETVGVWGTMNGRFFLDENSSGPTGVMIGPPSPAGLEMLRMIKGYSWIIRPDPGP
ncbi:MAG TPA: hypothetical protein VIU12_16965 [Chryseolinea sp.]